jgi:hypothetical protein
VCGSVVIREEESQIDWLDFYLPIGGLEAADERADSLWDDDSKVPRAWRSPIDDFLVEAARRVQSASQIELGLIGWEVSGAVYRSELGRAPEPMPGILMLLPDERGELVRLDPAVDATAQRAPAVRSDSPTLELRGLLKPPRSSAALGEPPRTGRIHRVEVYEHGPRF